MFITNTHTGGNTFAVAVLFVMRHIHSTHYKAIYSNS